MEVVGNLLDTRKAQSDILDRVGFVAPKRSELALTVAEKPIEQLSRAELERIANQPADNH